jgi:hypothetical protein
MGRTALYAFSVIVLSAISIPVAALIVGAPSSGNEAR